MDKTDAIMVDLDGTLAIIGDRSPYDAARCEGDTLAEMVGMFVRLWYDALELPVLLMSGRQEKDRAPTNRWLRANNVPFDELWMRATDDNRNDAIVKEELYRAHVEPLYNVRLVLDDRQRVVDMWRRIGLTCWQVAPSPD